MYAHINGGSKWLKIRPHVSNNNTHEHIDLLSHIYTTQSVN